MIESDVAERIAAALEGRRSQRDFVDEFIHTWENLTRSFDGLIAALDSANHSISEVFKPSEPQVRVRDALVAARSGPKGSVALAEFQARLALGQEQVNAVSARVNRDTVNIGVVGRTKAGKSTLLRTITGLPDGVIPSSSYNPTTAAPSRIYHAPGRESATVLFHTWQSFGDLYLAPLHGLAALDKVPQTPDEFLRRRYPETGGNHQGGVSADQYLRKILTAQASFPSYRDLLSGPRERVIELTALRPYVAYPPDNDSIDHRPYHAVRSVEIRHGFPQLSAVSLGLIDLPGAGEVGLDIDRQFLREFTSQIDLLLMVKRPTAINAAFLDEDSYALNLADSARSGVALDDFYVIVINRDHAHMADQGYFDNAVETVSNEARRRGISVVTPDVASHDDVVRQLMSPTLRHLGARLAEMDRAAVSGALDFAAVLGGEASQFADAIVRQVADWQQQLPDEEADFRDRAVKLRDDLAADLLALLDGYDTAVATGEADVPLEQGIVTAVAAAREWVGNGLGRGSRAQWLEELRGPFAARALEAEQDEYFRAKGKITEIFGAIDTSLEDSVRALWDQVASVLRGRLTEELVPSDPSAIDFLIQTTGTRRARQLHKALLQLSLLKINYGSIVLRVTRPIVRRITWEENRPRTGAGSLGSGAGQLAQQVGDAAGVSTVGLPVASLATPAVQAAHAWWENTAQPRIAASGATTGGAVAKARRGAEGLYDELVMIVDQSISELDKALRVEARVMASVLAAAADQFFDTAIRSNDSERDFENLCRPSQRAIWPDDVDGGGARLAVELSLIAEAARAVTEAGLRLSDLGQARRLRPLPSPSIAERD